VVSRAGPHVKIPEWEQVLSAGAAATSLVFAAHALGFAASWLTEWYSYDRRVLDAIGVQPEERIAGFVHIGRQAKPTEDRPRPPLDQIVTRFGAE
jgi:nitroreductase